MTEPLRVEFTVVCSAEHAFQVWTERTSMWWPVDHSVSSEQGLVVTIEPHAGGRIFERTPGGIEHDWGEVVAWEPPRRIAYMWHIGNPRDRATEVDISFHDEGDTTRVLIVHGGWDRLGEGGEDLRNRNRSGWAGLLPHFEAACANPIF